MTEGKSGPLKYFDDVVSRAIAATGDNPSRDRLLLACLIEVLRDRAELEDILRRISKTLDEREEALQEYRELSNFIVGLFSQDRAARSRGGKTRKAASRATMEIIHPLFDEAYLQLVDELGRAPGHSRLLARAEQIAARKGFNTGFFNEYRARLYLKSKKPHSYR